MRELDSSGYIKLKGHSMIYGQIRNFLSITSAETLKAYSRKFISAFTTRMIAIFANIILTAIASRTMSNSDFANALYILLFLAFGSVVATAGINNIAAKYAHQRISDANIAESLALLLVYSTLIGTLTAFLIYTISDSFFLLFVSIFYIITASLVLIFSEYQRGLGNDYLANLSANRGAPGNFGVGAIPNIALSFFLLGTFFYDVNLSLEGLFILALMANCISLTLLCRSNNFLHRVNSIFKAIIKIDRRKFTQRFDSSGFSFSYMLIAITVLNLIFSQSDMYLSRVYLDHIDFENYIASSRLSAFYVIASSILTIFAIQYISSMVHEKKFRNIHSLAIFLGITYTLSTVFLVIVFYALGDYIEGFFFDGKFELSAEIASLKGLILTISAPGYLFPQILLFIGMYKELICVTVFYTLGMCLMFSILYSIYAELNPYIYASIYSGFKALHIITVYIIYYNRVLNSKNFVA